MSNLICKNLFCFEYGISICDVSTFTYFLINYDPMCKLGIGSKNVMSIFLVVDCVC